LKPVEGIISDLLDNPEKYVTNDSIELAKTSLTNKLVFLYETPSQYLKLWYDLKLDGLDQKYLETFPQNLNSVTRDQILQYAKKYYNRQNFYKFIAAPASLVKEKNKATISLP
jgi:predicted Zn-dependent peptidase